MKTRRFYCLGCIRWHGECSRSEHPGLCFHCWCRVAAKGWGSLMGGSDTLPVGFTWEGVLEVVAVNLDGLA